jgi:hypothetical protein
LEINLCVDLVDWKQVTEEEEELGELYVVSA